MVFGRKKKTTGPAGTYAGANPRYLIYLNKRVSAAVQHELTGSTPLPCRYNGGIVDDGVVEEQSRCCCFKMARAVSS